MSVFVPASKHYLNFILTNIIHFKTKKKTLGFQFESKKRKKKQR